MAHSIDLASAKTYLLEIIPMAGEILRTYFRSGKFTTHAKQGVDFATQADDEIDAFLRKKIEEKYPNSQFLTEETAPKDYSNLKDSTDLWVIDPIDGTANFARGDPNFAISVALVSRGVPRLGVVYLPVSQDVYIAQDDMPHATLNNTPIHVSRINNLGEATVACDWSWNMEKREQMVGLLGKFHKEVRQIKCMGSAAADIAKLAKG